MHDVEQNVRKVLHFLLYYSRLLVYSILLINLEGGYNYQYSSRSSTSLVATISKYLRVVMLVRIDC